MIDYGIRTIDIDGDTVENYLDSLLQPTITN